LAIWGKIILIPAGEKLLAGGFLFFLDLPALDPIKKGVPLFSDFFGMFLELVP